MSTKKTETTESGLEAINDSLTSMTNKVQDNKKLITICSLAVVAVVVIILAYVYFFRGPGINKANDAIGTADLTLAQGNDSVALAQYMNVAYEYGYDAANRAALQSAILLYQKGDYEKALDYLSKYSAKEEIIGSAAYSLKGDCYVNLDKLQDAVKCYKDAISQSDENPAYTPYFMLKLARVYEAQKKYADQLSTLEKIKAEYPSYCGQHRVDLDAMIDLARLRSNAK